MSAWAIVVVVANSVGRSYPVHSISISAVAPQGRHRRAEPGSPPGWPRGDLLRPHHARVVPRLVVLVSDVIEHHLHRPGDDDLAFNPGQAVPRSESAPSDCTLVRRSRGKVPAPVSPGTPGPPTARVPLV